MAGTERRRSENARSHRDVTTGRLDTDLVPGPVPYALLSALGRARPETPILLWLHGGGGSSRFLETCRPHFLKAWSQRLVPSMVVATPSAGWSYYLDFQDGSELWERFLLDEFIAEVRRVSGAAEGRVYIGGISSGALGALRMAFKFPERFAGVVALEPTIEAASTWENVRSRDLVPMPESHRRRVFGQPLDDQHWNANHPAALVATNGVAIAANDLDIYLEAGDQDRLRVHHGVEHLHRRLFDRGISHEYRLVQRADHVGVSIGPRILEGLSFLGRSMWRTHSSEASPDALVERERFRSQVADLERQAGFRRTESVATGTGNGSARTLLTVEIEGDGPPVVLLPHLGRGADDLADLAGRLAANGYQAVRPEPRGRNGSSRVLADITLLDLADDIASVIRSTCDEPATLVGHDFGGTLARAVGHRHRSMVESIVLLAAPGPTPAPAEAATAMRRILVPDLTMEEHLEAISVALFAEGNDPVAWYDGWHRFLARAQAEAQRRTPTREWADGGGAECLIVRPVGDRLVSEVGTRELSNELSGRTSTIELPGAGHSLLPEQPAAVAVAVLGWLGARGLIR